jgi:hypothetical protein
MPHRIALAFAGGLALWAAQTTTQANCFPAVEFSQIATGNYHYVLFPAGSPATAESIVGRFWQPGQYTGTNQGSCDETFWLTRCGEDCTIQSTGPVFYINGTLGGMSCDSGCPDGEMIVMLEERGGLFLIARVNETPGPMFDFSRLGTDLVPVPIPKPRVVSSAPGVILGLEFDDPAAGFRGLPGVPATTTITAIHVLIWRGVGTPPLGRQGWTLLSRLPYTGGTTSGTVNIGDPCPPNGANVHVAAALELENGAVLTDYISSRTITGCIPERWYAGGHVPEGGSEGLQLSRSSEGELTLSWSPSCVSQNIVAIYEGVLGDWTSHAPRDCGVGPTTATFAEPEGSAYYLVVPVAVNLLPPDVEGSYGLLKDGSERSPSAQACYPQAITECP